MCGIAGKIYLNGGEVRESDITKMTSKIIYRGPDDCGVYISNNKKVGFGSRRLAIIDLSKSGHQPMPYKDKYWITYNGEVYNFQEERKRLVKLGYKFNSETDTEVILALYDKYGVKCLSHLRGMFAFAIYDEEKQFIFMARDRVGKKPFKYYFDGKVFIFASELKAILTQSEVHKTPDFIAIHDYLTYGYVPAPRTGFAGIQKIEAGFYLTVNLTNKTITKKQYWTPDFSKKLDLSETEWSKLILKELEEATKLRMISDVPVGAFLSGGVDSSAVVAMMAKNSRKPIKTFTISYKEKTHDERKYARRISQIFGTEHNEFEVNPESIEKIPEMVAQYEEQFLIVVHL